VDHSAPDGLGPLDSAFLEAPQGEPVRRPPRRQYYRLGRVLVGKTGVDLREDRPTRLQPGNDGACRAGENPLRRDEVRPRLGPPLAAKLDHIFRQFPTLIPLSARTGVPRAVELSELKEVVGHALPPGHPVRIAVEAAPNRVSFETYLVLSRGWVKVLGEQMRQESPP
jgi:hypothetical protein